jgi:hypothetical protein
MKLFLQKDVCHLHYIIKNFITHVVIIIATNLDNNFYGITFKSLLIWIGINML